MAGTWREALERCQARADYWLQQAAAADAKEYRLARREYKHWAREVRSHMTTVESIERDLRACRGQQEMVL